MTNNNIQQLIDSGNGVILLPPGEFKGPFYVDHPCTVEGNGTTLWNSKDFVIAVNSSGVTLKNLRVELIDTEEGGFSVCSESDTKTENVEIIGHTAGFAGEDTVPESTRQLKLGKFRAEEANTFIFEVYSPGEAELVTDMQDIALDPVRLSGGVNRVRIKTSGVPSGTFIYGDILMKSEFIRRFYVQGQASESTETVNDRLIRTVDAAEAERLKGKIPENEVYVKALKRVKTSVPAGETAEKRTVAASPEIKADVREEPAVQQNSGVHVLARGERVSIDNYKFRPLRIYMSFRALFSEMDIDPYAFMLDETGVTSCDDDFVFFGNRETMSGAITFMDDGSIELDLNKVPDHIKKISFVYSIYQPGPNDNFSKVMDPFVSVLQDGSELFRYTASELFAETTIIFMEIYKHRSEWKLNTIGQGYREGLKRLCASYGLIVS